MKITVDLSNVKYALAIECGGWSYNHKLYLIMNDGKVYMTEEFEEEDVIPSKTIEAYYLGNIDVSKEFIIPKHLAKCVMDAPNVMVFDSNLNEPIYNAYGWEEEFRNYFKDVYHLGYEFSKKTF